MLKFTRQGISFAIFACLLAFAGIANAQSSAGSFAVGERDITFT
ncbi:MAG: hypothetical protein RLZZ519_3036, partial [Bacteroidota bacterium]